MRDRPRNYSSNRFSRPVVSMMPDLDVNFYAGLIDRAQQNLERGTALKADFLDKVGKHRFHTEEDRKSTLGIAEDRFSGALDSEFVSPSRIASLAMNINQEISPRLEALRVKDEEVQRQRKMQDQWGIDWMGNDISSVNIMDEEGKLRDSSDIRGININRAQLRDAFIQGRGAQFLDDRPAGMATVPGSGGALVGLRSTRGIPQQERELYAPGTTAARSFAQETFGGLPENIKEQLLSIGGSSEGAFQLLENEIYSAIQTPQFKFQENWQSIQSRPVAPEELSTPPSSDRNVFASGLHTRNLNNKEATKTLKSVDEAEKALQNFENIMGNDFKKYTSMLSQEASPSPEFPKSEFEEEMEDFTKNAKEKWSQGEAGIQDIIKLTSAGIATMPVKANRWMAKRIASAQEVVGGWIEDGHNKTDLRKKVSEVIRGEEFTNEDLIERGKLLGLLWEQKDELSLPLSKIKVNGQEVVTIDFPKVGGPRIGKATVSNIILEDAARAISDLLIEGPENLNNEFIARQEEINEYLEKHQDVATPVLKHFTEKALADGTEPNVFELSRNVVREVAKAQQNLSADHSHSIQIESKALKDGEADYTARGRQNTVFYKNLNNFLFKSPVPATKIETRSREREQSEDKVDSKAFQALIADKGITSVFFNPTEATLDLRISGEDNMWRVDLLSEDTDVWPSDVVTTLTRVKNFLDTSEKLKNAEMVFVEKLWEYTWKFNPETEKLEAQLSAWDSDGNLIENPENELQQLYSSYLFNRFVD